MKSKLLTHPYTLPWFLLLFVGLLVSGILGLDGYLFFHRPIQLGRAVESYTVEPGYSNRRITQELTARGLLKRPLYWHWYIRLGGYSRALRSGEYAIDPAQSPLQLLEQLTRGDTVQHSLTVIEGQNFSQLMERLASHDALVHTLLGLPEPEIVARIGLDGHPEGQFLADTYHFPRGTRDIDFLRRAHRAMNNMLAREWQARDENLPLSSPYDALILASIIEKETALESERSRISGVFMRRLQKGMRLQTDPTVIYGLGADFDGNLRRRDLQRDTPYNSYTRHGLPPTPIAMPGKAAVLAALHPMPGNSLYFVSRGDGSHHFSSTFKEHQQAVRRYQLRRHQR